MRTAAPAIAVAMRRRGRTLLQLYRLRRTTGSGRRAPSAGDAVGGNEIVWTVLHAR